MLWAWAWVVVLGPWSLPSWTAVYHKRGLPRGFAFRGEISSILANTVAMLSDNVEIGEDIYVHTSTSILINEADLAPKKICLGGSEPFRP